MDQSTLNIADERLAGASTPLTNCDQEPIHIPGLIQPYGFLLCLDEQTRCVVQASANTEALLAIPAEKLVGQALTKLLAADKAAEIDRLWDSLTTTARLLGVRFAHLPDQPFYRLILHRHDGLVWVEGEPVPDLDVAAVDLSLLHGALLQMRAAGSVRDFGQRAVEQVRAVTGFDRVVLCRFGDDESGEVVAEASRPDLAPWLGLRYPATDIPRQARALYLKNRLRFIPDVNYVPVPLVPARTPTSGRPPDMTYAMLRSVSPMHLEYLRNMGSAATMTISVIRDGRLWGIIACHHLTPRLLGYELRDLCQFIGKTFSSLLKEKEQQDEAAYSQRILETQARLFDEVSSQAYFIEGLHQRTPTVRDVFDCGGAAICFGDDIISLGNTPSQPQLAELLAWLRQHVREDLFHTDSYVRHNPAGVAIRDMASGLLAVALGKESGDYLIWFRPEQVQTVTWAGQDQKAEVLVDGQLFLSPRQSFEAWKQVVKNTAVPWLPVELEAAQNIRLHLAAMRLRSFNELRTRAASLGRLNAGLTRSNDELNSFL